MADDEDGGIGGAGCPEKPNVPEPSTAIRFCGLRRRGVPAGSRGFTMPDGQISALPVQSPLQKYSRSLLTQITCISLVIPAHTKGRFAIVTNVGSGCDGRELR
jgi:hypothetical protein